MSKRNIHSVKKSNYLTRADVDPAVVATIREVAEEYVGQGKEDTDLKWVVYFEEFDKGMVLNWINSQTIAKLLGSEDFDDWTGGKVVLYDDENVAFAGKIVGGIRVRRAKQPKQSPAKPRPADPDDDLDEAFDELGEDVPQ